MNLEINISSMNVSSSELNVSAISMEFTCKDQAEKLDSMVKDNLEYVLPVHLGLCVISCMVSFINLVILTRPAMTRSPLNLLLAALEASNLVMAALYIPPTVVLYWFSSCLMHSECSLVVNAFINQSYAAFHCSCWITTFIGAWRLVAIRVPLKAKVILTKAKAKAVFSSVALICSLSYILVYFEVMRQYFGRTLLCDRDDFELIGGGYVFHLSKLFIFVISWLVLIVYEAIPSALLLMITTYLLWSIPAVLRQRRCLVSPSMQESQGSMRTTVLLSVLLTGFLLSNTSHFVPYILMQFGYKELKYPWKYCLEVCFPSIVMNIGSILIYYNMSTKFRHTLLAMFTGTSRKDQHKHSSRSHIQRY